MNVYNFCGTNVNIGAGVGRRKKDFLLIKLLDELKIKYSIGQNTIYYHENIVKIDFNKIIKNLKNNYKKEVHGSYSFKKFATEFLGKEKYNEFITNMGYSDFENEDAYETLYYYGLDDNTGSNEVMYIKWNELLDGLVNKIGNNIIKTNNNVVSINKLEDYFIIKNNKNKLYKTKNVIIASTINTVKSLLPNYNIYNNIKGQEFLRVYGKFDEKSTEIMNNIIKGYTIVNGPIKKIIPINKETGIYMIAYTDNKGAKFFSNHLIDKNFFCNQIEKTLELKKNTLKLKAIKSFYWTIGTHYYKPFHNKINNFKDFILEAQHPDTNIFIVGEMISRNQGWTQGALESVENIKGLL
jgi:hypothetical protein